jgi:pantoate--beta-alanine ligase
MLRCKEFGQGMSEAKPLVVRSVSAMRGEVGRWKMCGETVGVVPTMGALHAGHLALVRSALAACDRVIVTIFVNPIQFAVNEDLSSYPRGEQEDLAKLSELGADLVFSPNNEEMYPDGFATSVKVKGFTEVMCGAGRPHHFDGVATVVSKIFIQSRADRAYFGEKDFQQYLIVSRMAQDLDIPVEVIPIETVREADGLAMSSRNVYLSDGQRLIAPMIYKTISNVAEAIRGGDDPGVAAAKGTKKLVEAGIDKVEYLDVRDARTLSEEWMEGCATRVFTAVHLGKTRLIDNVAV